MKKNIKLPDLTNQHIITTDYEDEMKQSYIDYAMSVIAARALPDIRDGLKPVQRRTLYAMKDLNVLPDKPYRKCARIVGDTMGKYHPHGDGSIYNSMVRMAQEFTYKDQLIDGHGNFGSIDGDSAAAMRYTEARLKPISLELLEDIDKNIVEMKTNFDETLIEPSVLPAKFPNALINGMTGIAVGMSTNFPTHNLKEIIDGTIAYINNNNISIKELMTYIKGPDFPTGGIIANKDQLENIYSTGKGKIKIRAKIDIKKLDNGKCNIIIREIPYTLTGNKSLLIENIVELVKNKKLNGIQDIRDESSRGDIEIIIETKKDVDPYKLVNKLYSKTRLEDNFSVNMLALYKQKPYLFNLKSAIQKFVEFQQEIYTKRYKYLLEKELEKKESAEGLLKAYDEIDIIIEAIRGAKNAKAVKKCLITGDTTDINFKTKKNENRAKRFNYTEKQATIILEMRLYKLISLEKIEVEKQYKQIIKKINTYEKIIEDKNELNKTIITELLRISEQYSSKRKTKLKNLETISTIDEKIIEDVYVLVDNKKYIKAINTDTFIKNKEKIESEMLYIIKATTEDKICLFDKKGYLYKIKVADIEKTKLTEKGTAISNLTQIDENSIVLIDKITDNNKLLFLSKYGLVKQVNGTEFNCSRSKILATKVNDDDCVLKIIKVLDKDLLITVTNNGFALIIDTDEIPNQKRTTKGVSLIKLDNLDYIVDIAFINSNQKTVQIIVDNKIHKKNISAIGIRKRNSRGKQIFSSNKNIIRFHQ